MVFSRARNPKDELAIRFPNRRALCGENLSPGPLFLRRRLVVAVGGDVVLHLGGELVHVLGEEVVGLGHQAVVDDDVALVLQLVDQLADLRLTPMVCTVVQNIDTIRPSLLIALVHPWGDIELWLRALDARIVEFAAWIVQERYSHVADAGLVGKRTMSGLRNQERLRVA